jgi:integrase
MPTVKVALAQTTTSRDWAARQGLYFKRNWGVEIVGIKPVTSGYMLALRYKILDAEKAKQLNDRNAKAYIIDEASGIRLAVPAMEKVGELRSGTKPEVDRIYFMVFGNPGKLVKSGSRVTLVVGNFRADGLIVN